MRRMSVMLVWMLGLIFCLSGVGTSGELEIDRMTKEQLQAQLSDPDVVAVDVRTGRDWKSSEFKIKGAVRPGDDIVKWAMSYEKDTVFVLYCA